MMMMIVIMMAKIVMMLKEMLMDIKITVMRMITLKILMPFIAAHEMTRNQTPVDLEFETYSLDRRQR